MNTVIIINLNGNAFHLEDAGFQSLRAYLERAQAQLKDNPDKTEIMADLEQAIADKCARFLQPHKNVLSAAEIDEVLKEMGPVQSEDAPATGAAPDDHPPRPETKTAGAAGSAPKRLYQIREGAMLSGVCAGLAAYFNIDVTIVRIAFVLLTVLTSGIWILVYLVMMLVVPFANTGEEHAAAAGAPFNAQEVIDRAKKHYAEFKDSKEWRRHWRQQRREWRRRWHEGAYWWGHNLQRNVHQFSTGAGYGGHLGAALLIPFLAVFNAVLFCVWIAAIVSLATTGTIFGWVIGGSVPLWVSIVILMVFYGIISRPLRHARRAIYFGTNGHNYMWFAAWYEVLSTGVLIAVCWFAYTHVPQVHEFFQHFVQNCTIMWNNFMDSMHHAPLRQPTTSAFSARLPAIVGAASASAFMALRM
ncbi:MAG TPA: PspC domain-containing protein [Steroidobacteraceae bacterium]|jgi:phage shock protein PspC (stress-responsive transcriptional regulator)|nr:PspC domain-containing protein [Steroidobacteraceae bacterium]